MRCDYDCRSTGFRNTQKMIPNSIKINLKKIENSNSQTFLSAMDQRQQLARLKSIISVVAAEHKPKRLDVVDHHYSHRTKTSNKRTKFQFKPQLTDFLRS